MFDDPGFDRAREKTNALSDLLRRHDPFEPYRLPVAAMEYKTLPDVMKKLEGRWEPLD